jgi:hypothetical protein
MRMKTFFIAALIIGAMAFPFRHNAMPVTTNSASPATLTVTADAAQDINPRASYDAPIMDFNPFSLLFGRNVLPGATHSAFPATLTATAAMPDFPGDGSGGAPVDARITDFNNQYGLLSRGTTPSQAEMYYKTNYCDEAWEFVSTNPNNAQGPYQIRHSNTQTCLVVRGDGNGAVAVQTTCDVRYSDQLWYIGGSPGVYWFLNANSGKYLCHAGLAPVRQYSDAGYANSPTTYYWNISLWNGCKTGGGKCIAPSACPN